MSFYNLETIMHTIYIFKFNPSNNTNTHIQTLQSKHINKIQKFYNKNFHNPESELYPTYTTSTPSRLREYQQYYNNTTYYSLNPSIKPTYL